MGVQCGETLSMMMEMSHLEALELRKQGTL